MDNESSYGGRRDSSEYAASGLLPADEYSLKREQLSGLSTVSKSQVETKDFYGNAQTWLIETHRMPDGATVGFLQRITQDRNGPRAMREVLPVPVMRALLRHDDLLTGKARSRAAKRAAETRKAKGIVPAFVKDPSLRGARKGTRKRKRARRKPRAV